MPDELKSFLISASIILAIALCVPCIELTVRLVRHSMRKRVLAKITEIKPAKGLRRNVA